MTACTSACSPPPSQHRDPLSTGTRPQPVTARARNLKPPSTQPHEHGGGGANRDPERAEKGPGKGQKGTVKGRKGTGKGRKGT
eukprot:1086389-Rhodomonas_salina.2